MWGIPGYPLLVAGRTSSCPSIAGANSQIEFRSGSLPFTEEDSVNIEQVQEAIKELQQQGYEVWTRVFAAPGFNLTKTWGSLFERKEVQFRPVERNPKNPGEANDEAIVRACKMLAASKKNRYIVLLASDCGFLDVLQEIAEEGASVCLCTSARNLGAISRFRTCGVRVIELVSQTSSFSAVRAILNADGSGHVELAKPFKYDGSGSEDRELCSNFLHDLGYLPESDTRLTQSTAKFWFANSLGSIAVFPQQLATEKVCRMVSRRRRWQRYRDDLVLLLPLASPRRLSTKQRKIYGTRLGQQLYVGGGPVMLKDTKNLVQRAFTKLGYLDGCFNTDLAEAALLFVNASDNCHRLRKVLDLLPSEGDTVADVIDKLRSALRSNLTDARWRVAPSDSKIRQLLCKQGFLSNVNAVAEDVLRAMSQYSLLHGLPAMRSYNGYVFRILRSLDSSIGTTRPIEIGR
ncbi:hypothetical protein AK812_SmicGene107 [Symbiodinium microadriaticum]|uniref:NYN domain-containing protein n=1 Tax=Symbiodinium microadriaticum TaxID=2951 RepID=A0A1Q9F7N5_SYMMI|nr:hypothetical protein AK812_SmicGene107 [Symbiodinium microadriaticum]CAE7541703.1 unnamed protein product [Symbiodinium sp. KB8]